MKRLVLALGILVLGSGCASMNKKFNNLQPGQIHPQLKQIEGKDPKAAAAILGEPISVGWYEKESLGSTRYYLAYVVGGDGQTSTMDLMMGGDNLQCRYFFFEHEDGFKHTGSNGNAAELSCGLLKRSGSVYDDSKIK